MFSRDTWQEIFLTIRKNKLRTILSGFTVSLGILIFVGLVGMTNGLQNTFEFFFSQDATNVMYVFPGRTSMPYKGYKSLRQIEFENGDLTDIKKDFPMFIEYISPRIFRSALVKYKEESNNYTTIGNIVIGRLVEQDLFGAMNSMGKFIDVGGSVFKVVGVFQDDGGDNEERQLYMAYTTRQLIEKNTDKIGQIVIGFKEELGYTGAMVFQRSLEKYLKDKKFISPDDENGFFVRNVADQLKQNQDFAGVLAIIAALVAFGTIIAGIIGISNIMVYVVKERTKEIGIRKAIGATPRSVISVILLESIFITTISGFLGMIIGMALLSTLGDSLMDDYFILNPGLPLQQLWY